MSAVINMYSLALSKENATSTSALERQSGIGSESLTTRNSPKLPVSKRKAKEFSSSDSPSDPASRHPAPGQLFGDGHAVQGSTDELAAQSSRQLGSAESGL